MRSIEVNVEQLIAAPGGLEAVSAHPEAASVTQPMIVKEVRAAPDHTLVLGRKSDHKR